ncbi:MAG: PASTA domain-containing protein, partial [Clostridia bacterium]|nr:PASTA domain-containing protein [Clostridia bacterium]
KSLERQLELTFAYSAPNARAAGVVMNVKTGAVLAMGVAPGFDPNSPYTLNSWYQGRLDASGKEEGTSEYNELKKDYLLEMWSNKTVSELYEPGSTFKVITAAMALESGAVRETDHFYCNGAYYVGGFKTPIHCHLLWGHGDVTFRTGLQKSCNPTLMATSERIGADRFYDYFGAFGFFARSGVDLPGEALTYFHSKEGFGPVELAVASFGQRFKTSMIQQITAISCVANGGSLITPHLLSALVDENGKTVYSYEPEVKRQVISESVSRQINDILEESVFVQGGNPNAYVKGYRVSAKTGTSEKFDVLDENGNSYLRVGSTVAYAPANDPEIAVLIIVDEPTCSNTYGSNVAAPYVAQLLSEALPYLGFEPSYTAEELATLEMNVGNYVGLSVSEAKEKGRSAGLTVDVVGDGATVTSQVPSSGVYVTKGSARVVLYTGNELAKNSITVPDVAGQTAAAASQSLVNAGLSVHVIGATDAGTTGAVVIEQSPSAGEVVTKGTVVTITMRHLGNTD